MDTLPTIRVKTAAKDNPDGFYLINQRDFDEAVHELFEPIQPLVKTSVVMQAPEPKPAKPELVAVAVERVESVPVFKPKIGRPKSLTSRPKPQSNVIGRRPKPNPQTVQPRLPIVREPPPENWQTTIGMAEDTTT